MAEEKLEAPELLKLAHATYLEEYRALRAEYNQNVVLLNGSLAAFFTAAGVTFGLKDPPRTAGAFFVFALLSFSLGWVQLHFLRTNLNILRRVTCDLAPSLRAVLERLANGVDLKFGQFLAWEDAYVRQLQTTHRDLTLPVVFARFLLPYTFGSLFCLWSAASLVPKSVPPPLAAVLGVSTEPAPAISVLPPQAAALLAAAVLIFLALAVAVTGSAASFYFRELREIRADSDRCARKAENTASLEVAG